MNNYDRMMLAQQKRSRGESATIVGAEGNSATATRRPIDYSTMTFNDYMLNVLYRTEPSEAPVMSKEDFDRMRVSSTGAVGIERPERVQRSVGSERTEKKSKFNLTKKGKIILAVYVILILLLASILIVSNTVGTPVVDKEISSNEKISAAYGSSDNPGTQYIRAMTIDEEKSEEGGWFDKLCDSLNK